MPLSNKPRLAHVLLPAIGLGLQQTWPRLCATVVSGHAHMCIVECACPLEEVHYAWPHLHLDRALYLWCLMLTYLAATKQRVQHARSNDAVQIAARADDPM